MNDCSRQNPAYRPTLFSFLGSPLFGFKMAWQNAFAVKPVLLLILVFSPSSSAIFFDSLVIFLFACMGGITSGISLGRYQK